MQKVLAGISKGMSSEQLFERLCDIHFDQEVLQLLRAFTALEFLGHPAITALTLLESMHTGEHADLVGTHPALW